MQRSDAELVLAWSSGEQAAGRHLINRHFDAVRRFFENKVQGAALDDLVQQTFLACVESRERFRGDCSFRTFLFQIARHQLYGHYRRAGRDAFIDASITSVCDLRTSPTGLLSRRDNERILLEALQSLPVELQLLLELTFWENLSAADVAIVLDIAEGTVYTRVHRARSAIHRYMREAGASCEEHVWSTSSDEVASWMRSIRAQNLPSVTD